MSKWKRAKLGAICEIVSGTTPSTQKDELWNGDIKWITPAEIREDSYYIYDTERHISEKAGLKLMPAGTVLLSSRAPIGKVAIAGTEMACNQGFKNLICTDKIQDRYLYWFLKSKTEQLNSLGRGATFKELSKSIVENVEIPLPPLPLQHKLADIFGAVSALIEKRKTQINKLDLLVKSRFVEMFGDPFINPYDLPKTTLKEVAIGKLSYGSGVAAVDYDGHTRYVRITDITEGGELNKDVKSPQTVDDKHLLKNGDVLFARSGATVGKTFMYSEKHGRCIYAGFLIRLTPNLDLVAPEYLFSFTQSDYYKKFVENTQRVVAQPNINAQEYGDLELYLPPIELQKQFAAFVTQTDKSKFAIQKSLEELETLKKALMQQYFG